MIKTNKSYTKRLKVSKNGKITARGAGHCHFNSRQNRRGQLDKNRQLSFSMTAKSKSRFLANA
jgi:ribosomal protein L35